MCGQAELWLLLGIGGSLLERALYPLLRRADRQWELAMGLALRQVDACLERRMRRARWPHGQWVLLHTRRLPRLLHNVVEENRKPPGPACRYPKCGSIRYVGDERRLCKWLK